jgi:hypothetical protein
MHYIVRANPTSPIISLTLRRLRARAKRAGYRVTWDRYRQTYSLVDAQLCRPLLGLDHVALSAIVDAVEQVRR